MRYSVIKKIKGQPDKELCIVAKDRKEAIRKAKLRKGRTISITKWWGK